MVAEGWDLNLSDYQQQDNNFVFDNFFVRRELLAINCRLNTTHSSRNIRVDCSMGIDSLKDLVAKHHWHEIKCNFRWWKHQQDAFGTRNRDEKFSTVRNMMN